MKRKRQTETNDVRQFSRTRERLCATLLQTVLMANRVFDLDRGDIRLYEDICRETDGDNDALQACIDKLSATVLKSQK